MELISLQRCERCGTRHPRESTAGLCPACLIRLVTGDEPGPTGARDEGPAAPSIPRVGSRVGDHVLEAALGEGGMGVIFRARHLRLKRDVALKMLPFGRFSPDPHQLRFRAEAEAFAALRHPNIVTLYEVGEHEGQPFLSMEYIDGPDLGSVLQKRPVPMREAVQLVARVAHALHHAHQRGIAHRDLKPSNILIDADGHPHVTDFGLAKNSAQTGDLTIAGQPFGSPNYIPPEQARGDRNADVFASDVYGIGAILYHLLAHRPPFAGETVAAVLRQLAEEEPVEPRRLDPGIPRDLESICLKCLEKNPRRRYESAAALADDLERFLRDEPICARPIGPASRGWRWCRRRPALAGMTAATGLTLCAGLVTSVVLWRQAQSHAQQATENLLRVELEQVEDLFERGQSPESLARLARLVRLHPQDPVVAQRIVSALTHRNFLLPASPEFENTHDGRVSPLAVSNERIVSATESGRKLVVWKITAGFALETEIPTPQLARLAAFSGDGATLAIAMHDRTVQFWNLADRPPTLTGTGALPRLPANIQLNHTGTRLLASLIPKGIVAAGARTGELLETMPESHLAGLSPDGRWLVTATNATAILWDAESGVQTGRSFRHAFRIETARFSPDSSRLVTSSADKSARIWDVATGRPVGRRLIHPEHVVDAVFSPDGQRILTQTLSNQATLWDAISGMPMGLPFSQWRQLNPEMFSPDGLSLLTHFQDRVWLRDAFTGDPQGEPIVTGTTSHVRFLPDGRRFVTTGYSGRARLWSVQPGDAAPLVLPHTLDLVHASFSADGTSVLTCSKDKSAQLWSAADGRRVAPSFIHERRLACGTFNVSGSLVATGDAEGNVRVWDTASRELLFAALAHTGEVAAVAFSPDGRWLLSSANDVATLWDMATRTRRFDVRHTGGIRSAAISPNGRHGATAGGDRTIRVWTLEDGKHLAEFRNASAGAACLAFSPDGAMLAGSDGGRIRFWNIATRNESLPTLHHGGPVVSVRYSQNGRLLASASQDNTARVWDADTRKALTRPLSHRAEVVTASISPDGRHVLTASYDHTARVWSIATGQPVTDALKHGNRVEQAEWAPHGRAIVTASWDGSARVWSLPLVSVSSQAAAWLANAAEAFGGLQMAENDVPQRVSRDQVTALERGLSGGDDQPRFTAWAQWLLADRVRRAITPDSTVSAADHARSRFDDWNPERLRDALRYVPMDASGLARWSRVVREQSSDRNPRRQAESAFAAGLAAKLDAADRERK